MVFKAEQMKHDWCYTRVLYDICSVMYACYENRSNKGIKYGIMGGN